MLMACQIAIIITKNGKLVSKIKICNISRSLCCCNIWLRFLWKKILPFCMQPQLVTLFPTVLPPSESQASLQLLSCVCELPVGLHLRSGCDLLWWVRVCVCVCVCLSVCLSVCPRGYLLNRTRNLYQIFVHVGYGRGSVLLQRRCDTLCISGFVDDIMFLVCIRDCIAVWISLRTTDFACIYLFTVKSDKIQFPIIKGHNFDYS